MRTANPNRARACAGKRRHLSRGDALRAMAVTGHYRGDLTLVVYACDHCSGFHVGHAPPSERRGLHARRLIDLIDKANRPDEPVEVTPGVGERPWPPRVAVTAARAGDQWKVGTEGGVCLALCGDPDPLRAELRHRGYRRAEGRVDYRSRAGVEWWANG